MKNKLSVFALSMLSFGMLQATTIFSDGLPTSADQYSVSTMAGNFIVTSGNVDILQAAGPYGSQCDGSAPCIDLNGDTPGTISSGNLTLTPGVYTLMFTLTSAHGAVGNTTVTLGSLFNQTYIDPTPGIVTQNVVTQTINVGTTTVVPLIFQSNVSGPAGDLLSAVSITTPGSTSTPEPASAFLLGVGALSAFAFRRRGERRKRCA